MIKRLACSLLMMLSAGAALAVDPVNKTTIGEVAIEGYDPVAYFTESRPVEGKKDFEHRWMEATWRFVSAANRDAFAKQPERYAPRYGGYCAYGVSKGYAVGIDPEAWSIVEGKLYLNYDKSVQKRWSKDIPGYIEKADRNWPEILAKK